MAYLASQADLKGSVCCVASGLRRQRERGKLLLRSLTLPFLVVLGVFYLCLSRKKKKEEALIKTLFHAGYQEKGHHYRDAHER